MKRKYYRPEFYYLDGHSPVKVPKNKKHLDFADRMVVVIAEDWVGDYHIGTWFTGVEVPCTHNPPWLFETTVQGFQNPCLRRILYSTWEAAEAGHHRVIRRYHNLVDYGSFSANAGNIRSDA